MPITWSRRRRWGGLWSLLLGSGMLVILLGLGGALYERTQPARIATTPAATPTIDSRLIIHARTVPIEGRLAPGAWARGTLYPAYPGRNTLRLMVQRRGRALSPCASFALMTVTMPGMAMAPIHARLPGSGCRYSGAITLPMFGAYRAQIKVATPDGPATGTITLPLSRSAVKVRRIWYLWGYVPNSII